MEAASVSRPSARLPLWIGVVASLLYAATFLFIISFSKTIFDAMFFVGLVGFPLSLVAGLIGSAIGGYIYVDLVFLFLFGMLEYFIVGYIVGVAISAFLPRR